MRQIFPTVLLLWVNVGLADKDPDLSGTKFSPHYFEKGGTKKIVKWPESSAFEKTWESEPDHPIPIGFFKADFGAFKGIVLRAIPNGETWLIRVLFGPNHTVEIKARDLLSSLNRTKEVLRSGLRTSTNLSKGKPSFSIQSGRLDQVGQVTLMGARQDDYLDLNITYVSPKKEMTDRAWRDWVYATTLQHSDLPIDEEFKIQDGLGIWDPAPVLASRKHAEKCLFQGRLGCFLQFHTRALSRAGPREVTALRYSSRKHSRRADLIKAGVDAEKYFLGVLYRFTTQGRGRDKWGQFKANDGRDRESLSPLQVAAAIGSTQRTRKFERHLTRVVEDVRIDEYNRYLATVALYELMWFHPRIRQRFAGLGTRGANPVMGRKLRNRLDKKFRQRLLGLKLSPLSRYYLAND